MGKLDELKKGAGGTSPRAPAAGVARRPIAEGISVPIGGARFKDLAKSKTTFEVPVDKIAPDPRQPRKIFTPRSSRTSPTRSGRGASCNPSASAGTRSGRST